MGPTYRQSEEMPAPDENMLNAHSTGDDPDVKTQERIRRYVGLWIFGVTIVNYVVGHYQKYRECQTWCAKCELKKKKR